MSYLHSLIPDLQFHMINKQMLKYMFAFIRIVFSEKSSSNENRITRPIHVHLYTFMYHLILKSYSICTNYVLRSDHSCILSTYYASLCGITTGKKQNMLELILCAVIEIVINRRLCQNTFRHIVRMIMIRILRVAKNFNSDWIFSSKNGGVHI